MSHRVTVQLLRPISTTIHVYKTTLLFQYLNFNFQRFFYPERRRCQQLKKKKGHFIRFKKSLKIIRIRKSKKNRQQNGQTKKYKGTNNDLQIIHIKLKTITFVFAATPLSMQRSGVRTKTSRPGIRIMCMNGATCLPLTAVSVSQHYKKPIKRVSSSNTNKVNDWNLFYYRTSQTEQLFVQLLVDLSTITV